MTAPQPEIPTAEPPPVQLASEGGTRLHQLHAMYPDAKAKADAAAAELKAITDGIKVELTQAAPDLPRVDLVGQGLPPLGLRLVTSWRIDSKRLKVQDPELYARYAKQSYAWTLKPLGAQGGED